MTLKRASRGTAQLNSFGVRRSQAPARACASPWRAAAGDRSTASEESSWSSGRENCRAMTSATRSASPSSPRRTAESQRRVPEHCQVAEHLARKCGAGRHGGQAHMRVGGRLVEASGEGKELQRCREWQKRSTPHAATPEQLFQTDPGPGNRRARSGQRSGQLLGPANVAGYERPGS